MRLRVIGCSGSAPGPDSPASCYLLTAEHEGREYSILLDLGSGAVGPLQRYTDPAKLDAVFISHGHPDHCSDLIGLSVLRRYGPAKDKALPLMPLYGPDGIDQRVVHMAGGDGQKYLEPFAYAQVGHGDVVTVGPFTVTAAGAWHPVPALAYLVEGPSENGNTVRLLYTGDTDRCAEVDALARQADVVLGEAGWAHREVNPEGTHMSGTQLGQMCAEAEVDGVLVTHIPSWVDPELTLTAVKAHAPNAALAQAGDAHRL